MATPPSLFPMFMDQPEPTGIGNLIDDLIITIETAPEVVVEDDPVVVQLEPEVEIEIDQSGVDVEVPE